MSHRNHSISTRLAPIKLHIEQRTLALFEMRFARLANFNVLCVSSKLLAATEMVQMIAIRALPRNEGSRIRVNLLSRNGMCPLDRASEQVSVSIHSYWMNELHTPHNEAYLRFSSFWLERREITLPSVSRLLLM